MNSTSPAARRAPARSATGSTSRQRKAFRRAIHRVGSHSIRERPAKTRRNRLATLSDADPALESLFHRAAIGDLQQPGALLVGERTVELDATLDRSQADFLRH